MYTDNAVSACGKDTVSSTEINCNPAETNKAASCTLTYPEHQEDGDYVPFKEQKS